MGESSSFRLVSLTVSFVCLVVICAPKANGQSNPSKPLVSALYIFGDSTVDPGNNNHLATLVKANFPPYGRDFADHKPTGRFCNGQISGDIISALLGLSDTLPAYLDPAFQGQKLLTGASFASSASGYDINTTRALNAFSQGARKFGVIGLPPFGCLPSQISLHNLVGNQCVEEFNQVAISFNQKLIELLETLQPNFAGLLLQYLNIYDKLLDVIRNPSKYGFSEARKSCCGTGLIETAILCNINSPTCPDASKYVFWDSFHPTDKMYGILCNDVFQQMVRLYSN
eukprot:Gb_41560 [translate_table: standard]